MNSGISNFISSFLGRVKSEKDLTECKKIVSTSRESCYDSDQGSSYNCNEKKMINIGDTKTGNIATIKKSVRQKIGEHLKTHKVCALYQTGSGIRIVLKKKKKKREEKYKSSDEEQPVRTNTKSSTRKQLESLTKRSKNTNDKKDAAIIKLETKLQRVLEKLKSLESTNQVENTSSNCTQLCNTFTQCSNQALHSASLSLNVVSSHQRLPKPRLHKTWHFKPYRNNFVEHTCQTIYRRSNAKKESFTLKFGEATDQKGLPNNENYLFDEALFPKKTIKSIEYKDNNQSGNLTVSLLKGARSSSPSLNQPSESLESPPNIRIMQLSDLMKPEDMSTILSYCRNRPSRDIKRKSSVQDYIENFNKKIEKEFNMRLGQKFVVKDLTSKIPVKTLDRPRSPTDSISYDSCVSNFLELEDQETNHLEKENNSYKRIQHHEDLPEIGTLALEPPPVKEKELDINLSGFIRQLEKMNVHNNSEKSKQVLETIKKLADCNKNLELLAHQFAD